MRQEEGDMKKATFRLDFGRWVRRHIVRRTSPMPSTIAEALEHSIQKWEFIERAIMDDPSPTWPLDGGLESCALCSMEVYPTSACDACPVGLAGHRGCDSTPYQDYNHADTVKEALAACRAEIAFLKSMRGPRDLNYYMGLPYIIQLRSNNEGWIAKVPALPGCIGQGDTGHEALDNIKEAMELWIETALDYGDPIPEPKEDA